NGSDQRIRTYIRFHTKDRLFNDVEERGVEQHDAAPLQSSRRDHQVKRTAREKYCHWQPEHRIASCGMGSHRRVSPCLSPGHCGKRSPLVRICREPYIKTCRGKNVSFGSGCVTL